MSGGSGVQQALTLLAGAALGVGLTGVMAWSFRAADHAQAVPTPTVLAGADQERLKRAVDRCLGGDARSDGAASPEAVLAACKKALLIAPGAAPVQARLAELQRRLGAPDSGASVAQVDPGGTVADTVPGARAAAPRPWLSAAWQAVDPNLPRGHPAAYAQARLRERFHAPELVNALLRYHQGDVGAAQQQLNDFAAVSDQLDSQLAAQNLLRDVQLFGQKRERAENELLVSRVEEAEESFFAALTVDDRLMGLDAVPALSGGKAARAEYLQKMASVPRTRLLGQMSSRRLREGKVYAANGDTAQACRTWQRALRFDGDTSAVREQVAKTCVPNALMLLRHANHCSQIAQALMLAPVEDPAIAVELARTRARVCRQ